MKWLARLLLLPGALALHPSAPADSGDGELARLQLPAGYQLSVYAGGLPGARVMRFTPAGDLLLSRPRYGKVELLFADADGDGRSDGSLTLLRGLRRPHGVLLLEGWLYVGETDRVRRWRFDHAARAVQGRGEVVLGGIPGGGNHWTRTLELGPDGWIYMQVGSTCNVCIERDARRATLMRFRPDGSGAQVYASGLRNTVGWAWQPGTGALYGVDNGRDWLGDDYPPCELNRIERGRFYGWPFRNGDNDPDPDFGGRGGALERDAVPPEHSFAAHTAPLAILFLPPQGYPGLESAALVSLHGSWNRSAKQGYEVVSLHWQPGGGVRERKFLHGFEVDDHVIGRPVDLKLGPDGGIYLSDDHAGAVYRILYRGGAGVGGAEPAAGVEPATEQAAEPAAEPAAEAAGGPPERVAMTASLAAAGQRLWRDHGCDACHGGFSAMAPLAGLSARFRSRDLEALLDAPPATMPRPDMTPRQRRQMALWLLAREQAPR